MRRTRLFVYANSTAICPDQRCAARRSTQSLKKQSGWTLEQTGCTPMPTIDNRAHHSIAAHKRRSSTSQPRSRGANAAPRQRQRRRSFCSLSRLEVEPHDSERSTSPWHCKSMMPASADSAKAPTARRQPLRRSAARRSHRPSAACTRRGPRASRQPCFCGDEHSCGDRCVSD